MPSSTCSTMRDLEKHNLAGSPSREHMSFLSSHRIRRSMQCNVAGLQDRPSIHSQEAFPVVPTCLLRPSWSISKAGGLKDPRCTVLIYLVPGRLRVLLLSTTSEHRTRDRADRSSLPTSLLTQIHTTMIARELNDYDSDAESTETLVKHYADSEPHFRRRKRKPWATWKTIAFHATAIACYGVVAAVVTIHVNSSRGQNLIYCRTNDPLQTLGSC